MYCERLQTQLQNCGKKRGDGDANDDSQDSNGQHVIKIIGLDLAEHN
jgi:hypothetical protein